MVGYGMQLTAAGLLYAAFALWSLAAWLIIRRLDIGPFFRPAVLASAIIVAPVLLAQMLIGLFWVVPGVAREVAVVLVFAVPIFIVLVQWRDILAYFRAAKQFVQKPPLDVSLLWASFGLIAFAIPLVFLLFSLVILPLHGNDPLEYMQLGRMFFTRRDASLYPILTALPESGFIAPWTHPPTYAVLIAFAFMLQSSAVVAGAAKLVGLWFVVATASLCAGLVYAADRRLSWRVWLTPAAVLTMPVYFELVLSAHIDALRIATFTVAIALSCHLLIMRTASASILAGIGIASAMLSHSIGILAPVIALPMLIVCWSGTRKQIVMMLGTVLGVSFLLGAPHYVRNVFIFGNPIQDNIPIWNIPSLRVQEFLRESRGLETLLDRLYLGAMMPWTRRELFGLLPILLLLAAPVALWRLASGGQSKLARLLAARRGSTTLHLSIAVLGFFALIFLSVFAGTELAVKNARYILTIIPCLVAVCMIVIGWLISDDATARTIEKFLTFGRQRLPRWLLPRRFRPDPDADATARLPLRALVSRVALFEASVVLIVLFIGASQILGATRIAASNAQIYLSGIFNLSGRLTESEGMKRRASTLDDALAETFTASTVRQDQTVLLFRQASFGFYTQSRFRFHADAALVDLFKINEVATLHADLLRRGLKWLLTPDFSLPEINNSAFAPLLMDASRVRPALRSNGWALYELRENLDQPLTRVVVSAIPAVGKGRDVFALTDQGSGMVDGRRAGLKVVAQAGTAELFRKRGLIKQLDRWDALVSRPARTGQNPDELNASDFQLSDDSPILVEAKLSGKGYAEIAVDYVTLLPIPQDGAQTANTGDESDKQVVLSREVLWSGVLEDKVQRVGGWLVPPLSRFDVGTDKSRRGARLIFRLRDGDRLTLHEWSATAAVYPETRDVSVRTSAVVTGGWSFTRGLKHNLRGITLRTAPPLPDVRTLWQFPPVGVERVSTAPVSIMPPSFWLPALDRTATQPTALRRLFDDYLGGAELELQVNASVAGFGKLSPTLRLYCGGPQGDINAGLMSFVLGGPGRTGGSVRDISMSSLQLWDGRLENLTWRERLPCLPYRARLLLRSEVQPLLSFEEFLKDTEAARSGYIDVHGVQMSLIGGRTGAHPITVPMELRDLPASFLARPSAK
jgi:hypothetical protein